MGIPYLTLSHSIVCHVETTAGRLWKDFFWIRYLMTEIPTRVLRSMPTPYTSSYTVCNLLHSMKFMFSGLCPQRTSLSQEKALLRKQLRSSAPEVFCKQPTHISSWERLYRLSTKSVLLPSHRYFASGRQWCYSKVLIHAFVLKSSN